MKQIKIALIGNPNCGKTTMFNDLTGSNQYVGNWPGVTVEKKEGGLKGHDDVIITDLPGIYSLSPYTLEEVVSRNYLLENDVDGVLNLVDGSNIERNLYLTTQVMEMGYPVTIALNMIDIVRKNGDKIDTKKLSAELGCAIVETSALQGEGTGEAAEKAISAVGSAAPKYMRFSSEVEAALTAIAREAGNKVHGASERWLLVKLFERDQKIAAALGLSEGEQAKIEEIIAACEEAMDDDSESIITNERYNYIGELMSKAVVKGQTGLTISDKIDSIVTNRFLALPIFAIVMFLVYYIAVDTVGTIVTDFTNDTLFGEWIQPWVQEHMEAAECEDWLVSLVVDGIIGGIGAPIGFAPQMAIVFLLLSFLEDCGYMARVAFIMDRFFRQFGMSGKSFIPLLISAGCGVPGIMASRTIENETDRRLTIMTTTFIPCGAKLPVIALLPGSRTQEIKKMLPVQLDLVEKYPEFDFVVAGVGTHSPQFYEQYMENRNVKLIYNQTYSLLNSAYAAVVTSGTATLEAALFNLPEVVCYKANALSFLIGKYLAKVKFISLVNLILNAPVVVELLQKDWNNRAWKKSFGVSVLTRITEFKCNICSVNCERY